MALVQRDINPNIKGYPNISYDIGLLEHRTHIDVSPNIKGYPKIS